MVRQWNVPAKRKGLTPQQRTRVFAKDDGICQGEGCGIKIDAARGDPFYCAHLHEDGKALWQGNDGRFDVNDFRLICEACWKGDTAEERSQKAKEDRVRTKHVAGHKPKGRGFQNSRTGPYKTCLTSDGPKTVRR